jgi:site-specific DNA-methyltransferase (adenine-specific)
MNTELMFSCKTDQWETPQGFFNLLDEEFHFTLDPCADESNHKCERYFTREQDGLKQDWSGEIVFCNPPYGRKVGRWVQKCFEEVYQGNCKCAVLLLFANTDTKWFHDWIYHKAEVRFIKGRLKFGGGRVNSPKPSMVVVFRKPGCSL